MSEREREKEEKRAKQEIKLSDGPIKLWQTLKLCLQNANTHTHTHFSGWEDGCDGNYVNVHAKY